ncbi:MAG: arylesterase [Geobacteraceae bacterium GWC2_53_11]|nr:MAG: arylesterase [Geobacteraceae bacterium GWC2_53_11]
MRAIKAYLSIMGVIAALLCGACSKTPQLPRLSADAVILAFGDSLTAGTGAGDSESYPAQLAQLTGRKVVNAGIPGEISADGLKRLPELLEREHPSLLILCHGGNDLLAHQNHQLIADNLRAMLRIAGERGIPVLMLAVPVPDLLLKPPPLYEELAREFQVPIEAKALPHILAKGSLKSDYIHPNAAGYRMLAEALVKLLKKSGALPA